MSLPIWLQNMKEECDYERERLHDQRLDQRLVIIEEKLDQLTQAVELLLNIIAPEPGQAEQVDDTGSARGGAEGDD